MNGFMKPKSQDATAFELFQAHFDQILNARHPLVRPAARIDWARFDAAFADSYNEELGAPGKAARLMENNPYDGHTLSETLDVTESVTGVNIGDVSLDKGCRGHGHDGPTGVHIAGSSSKNISRSERKRRRRRSAIEPKSGTSRTIIACGAAS